MASCQFSGNWRIAEWALGSVQSGIIKHLTFFWLDNLDMAKGTKEKLTRMGIISSQCVRLWYKSEGKVREGICNVGEIMVLPTPLLLASAPRVWAGIIIVLPEIKKHSRSLIFPPVYCTSYFEEEEKKSLKTAQIFFWLTTGCQRGMQAAWHCSDVINLVNEINFKVIFLAAPAALYPPS